MTRTVVVAFDAGGLVLGNATAKMPGMHVHLHVRPIEAGVLTTHLDIHGGGPTCIPIVHGLRIRYQCRVEGREQGHGVWRGRVTFLAPDELRGHAAYDALLDFAGRMEGASLHFQNGTGYMRLDLPDDVHDAHVAANLKARASGTPHAVAEMQGLGPLETWVPDGGTKALQAWAGPPQA